MPLTNLQIKNAPGNARDGNGLYLAVTGKGAKSWIFRYQLGGKRREMGLGPVMAAGPEARAMVAQLKLKVANGIDPGRARGRAAAEAAARAAEVETERQQQTFQKVAEAYIATHEAGWSNAKHIQQWTNTLKTYVYQDRQQDGRCHHHRRRRGDPEAHLGQEARDGQPRAHAHRGGAEQRQGARLARG
jgi:hypothetical protein